MDAPLKLLSRPPARATCVRIPGCYLVDLTPLPPVGLVLQSAVSDVTAQMRAAPEPHSVWILSPLIVEYFCHDRTPVTEIDSFARAIRAVTPGSAPRMIVEGGAPANFGLLTSAIGIQLETADLKFKLVDAHGNRREVSIMDQLAQIRAPEN